MTFKTIFDGEELSKKMKLEMCVGFDNTSGSKTKETMFPLLPSGFKELCQSFPTSKKTSYLYAFKVFGAYKIQGSFVDGEESGITITYA